MMKDEAALWAAATAMVKEHGANAPIGAAQEADAAFEEADLDRFHEWLVILRRATFLLEGGTGTKH